MARLLGTTGVSQTTLSGPPVSPVYVALDFETSDRGADAACALGLAKTRDGQVIDTWYSLIRPPRKRVMYTWVHGLTWPTLKDSPRFAELWPRIADFLADATFLVAHNAPFDRRVLAGCCAAAGISAPPQPFLCTLKASRRTLKLPSHRLNAVCAHCGIELTHHHAGSDALAAALILEHLHRLGLKDEDALSGGIAD